jgi:KaiC/GvpD/RAD55 family RecA-like ATPase
MAEPAPVMLELALAYAARGWRVFPLNGKVPAISKDEGGRGCLDATTDVETIRTWWSRFPHANVGIATGEVSGVLAIDLDGPEARQAWLALFAKHDPIATPWSRTGRVDGGIHILLRWPEGEHVPNRSQGAWSERVLGASKIEVIGEGRYIVAPGSLHKSGTRYAWGPEAEHLPLAVVPAWLLEKLREVPEPAASIKPTWRPSTERDASRARAYCLGALARGHDEVARLARGERNAGLVKVAYALGGYIPTGFLEAHEVREALRSACAHWPAREREVRKDFATIERGMHAGMSMPRDIPEPTRPERVPPPSEPMPSDEYNAERDEPLPPKPTERKWKPAAELAMELQALGPGLPTGFHTFDEWTRGGLRARRLVAIAGAPGAGKTLFATQVAHGLHDLGHPVAIYAVDEHRDGVMTRWGQQCGLVREDIEDAHEPTRRALASCFEAGLVDFIDPDEATLDEVGAWLVERARSLEMPGVLVVDSIQTCRIAGGETMEARQRVDAVVSLLKDLRKAGLLVLATSEVGRGWYRGGEKVDPLAAFKESGGIEYALDVGVVLESVKGEVGKVDVWIPKSRLGRADRGEPALRTHIDFARATMTETARPDAEAEAAPSEAERAHDEDAIARISHELIRGLLMASNPVRSRQDLYGLVRGRRGHIVSAVTRMLNDGRITGGRGEPFRVVLQGGQDGG